MEKEFYAYLEKRFYEFKEHPELLEVGEKAILESAIEYMEKKTGLKEIKIVGEEESKSLRAKRAMPWKPGELEMRGYNTVEEAMEGHYELCLKWSKGWENSRIGRIWRITRKMKNERDSGIIR